MLKKRRLARLLANNFGTADEGLSFGVRLQSSLVPYRAAGSPTPTFTRATTAYVTDFEGLLKPVLSGEARFTGARRVHNTVSTSSVDMTVGVGNTAGIGSVAATTVSFNNATAYRYKATAAAGKVGDKVRFSVKLSSADKAQVGLMVIDNSGGLGGTAITLTSTPTRYSILATVVGAGAIEVGLENRIAFGGDGTTSGTITATEWQCEIVTGQSNQNPSEYVSVGVLSAPYHGCNVDGVAYKTTLNANVVSANVVTEATGSAISSATAKFGVLIGITGDYFSTPNAAANQITGALDIRARLKCADWTPSTSLAIVSKSVGGAAGTGAYVFYLNTDGTLKLFLDDGSSATDHTSTAATGFADGTAHWVRVTFDPAGDIYFYTSEDGVTWTQLGTAVACALTSLRAGTNNVTIGCLSGGTGFIGTGANIYRAQVYNGIDGTLAVDFNPNTFASGTTWTSATTGEEWTINGNAKVFGGSGTSSIAAPWDAYAYGYLAEGARTNRCLYSQVFSNAAWVSGGGGIAVTDNSAVAPDGTTTADTLTASGANGTLIQDLGVVASASKTGGLWLKRKTGTGNIDITMDGGTGWTTVAVTTTWTRFQKNQTLADEDFGIRIVTSGDEVYAWQGQVETAAFLSSGITTTTAAVTRNADVLTYAIAGNYSSLAGSLYAEIGPFVAAGVNQMVFRPGGGNGWLYTNSTGTLTAYDGTNNPSLSGALSAGSTYKIAMSWGGSTMNLFRNGTAGSPGSFDGDMNATTSIGVSDSGGAWFPIRNVRIYNRALSDARLQAMTTP